MDILHCDINNFFASCEILENPEYKDVPLAVGGNEEDRRGVVLAKNYIAKSYGIQTGMTLYQAKKLCPQIVFVDTHFNIYNKYSKQVREILLRYTDRVEPFSIDESWLDVTHSKIFGTPKEIADKIRNDIKNEIGLTASVGVSFNKIFAKLGSDYKKPDATTVISKENYKNIVWNLPVNDLLGVGKSIFERLKKYGINTIGDLANTDKEFLQEKFGKLGGELYEYANGNASDEIPIYSEDYIPKSVGNSTTFYKDLTTMQEIELGFTILCENIVSRMIRYSLKKAKTLSIVVKNNKLESFTRQTKIKPCRNSVTYTKIAIELFEKNFKDKITHVRLLGVSVTDFVDECEQISFFDEEEKDIDSVMLKIRDKYGYKAILKGNNLLDKKIANTFNDDNDKNK